MTSRAVFLDRDGVINNAPVREGRPFPPASLADLVILDGVPGALIALRASGFKLIVVTNQPDVGRGQSSADDVREIHDHLRRTLALDDIRVCFHAGHEGCDCRKPRPGMLLAAARELDIDLSASFMVGDRWRDIDAGVAAGCRSVLIDYRYDEQAPSVPPDFTCASLAEAAIWIMSQSETRDGAE